MKLKIASLLLLSILVHKKANGQEQKQNQQEDTLQKPLFYSIAPKLLDISTKLSPNYAFTLNDDNLGTYKYNNEYVSSIKLLLPLLINKSGWYINGVADYQNYIYEVEYDNSTQNKNYSLYNFGFSVIKRFEIADKNFAFSNNLNAAVTDFSSIKNLRYFPSLTTSFKTKNNGTLLLGVLVLVDKDIKIPVLPIINYSSWISKPSGLLFSFNFPYIDINTMKVFNNKTMLKAGIGLLHHVHYIEPSDYPFLTENNDYKFRRTQLTLNTKFERTLFKGIWFGSEIGYAFNYKTGITTGYTYLYTDTSNNPNGLYANFGLFVRPVSSNWKK